MLVQYHLNLCEHLNDYKLLVRIGVFSEIRMVISGGSCDSENTRNWLSKQDLLMRVIDWACLSHVSDRTSKYNARKWLNERNISEYTVKGRIWLPIIMVTLAPASGVFGISITLSLMTALLLHRQMHRLYQQALKALLIFLVFKIFPCWLKLGPWWSVSMYLQTVRTLNHYQHF